MCCERVHDALEVIMGETKESNREKYLAAKGARFALRVTCPGDCGKTTTQWVQDEVAAAQGDSDRGYHGHASVIEQQGRIREDRIKQRQDGLDRAILLLHDEIYNPNLRGAVIFAADFAAIKNQCQ